MAKTIIEVEKQTGISLGLLDFGYQKGFFLLLSATKTV
ncbi:Uncharacterised protein [Campylobacter hyointestinalis subsp. hyointestinalis]|uniref:Uncharacterized protein n=1 Tax=Campylobacter hyointestinalis subsp. hyointestinalis TaxID=91352 RepID=A0A9W5ASB3_CAMHY|nr:Uncharacterised protein [Campylobacter hyointestinalis subsp. hyointestinalis]CUU83197.1 Uncharacterised protein [Campylobacter hyointestinalis subsp. hyointestinalis]